MAHWPVGSLVLLTAMSRWFVPSEGPAGRIHSRVSTTWNQRRVTRSNRQTRVGHERPERPGGPVDRRRVAVEAVLVDDAGQRVAGRVVHPEHVVDRLQHEAVADAQPLVGRLDARTGCRRWRCAGRDGSGRRCCGPLRARCHLGAGHRGPGTGCAARATGSGRRHAPAGGGHPRGRCLGLALLARPDLRLLEGPAADRAASDRGRPAVGDLPCDGVRARRRDPRAYQRSAAHARTGTSDQANTLLRFMVSPFVARADARGSCKRVARVGRAAERERGIVAKARPCGLLHGPAAAAFPDSDGHAEDPDDHPGSCQ